jgi:hypothetical protein
MKAHAKVAISMPAADERQMLGRHDNQIMPSINRTAFNSAGSPWTTYLSS